MTWLEFGISLSLSLLNIVFSSAISYQKQVRRFDRIPMHKDSNTVASDLEVGKVFSNSTAKMNMNFTSWCLDWWYRVHCSIFPCVSPPLDCILKSSSHTPRNLIYCNVCQDVGSEGTPIWVINMETCFWENIVSYTRYVNASFHMIILHCCCILLIWSLKILLTWLNKYALTFTLNRLYCFHYLQSFELFTEASSNIKWWYLLRFIIQSCKRERTDW